MAAAGILLAAALGGGLLFIARCFSSVARKVALRMPAGRPMEGKTAIITGANSGLGRATAAELLRQGARVIMACRDCGRAEEAARELRAEVGLCSRGGGECRGELVVHELDLASLRSVRSFCQQVLKEEPRLDVLINNAGIFQCPYMKTEDGFEMQAVRVES
ncbi:retinol dehydrogenase 14 [Crotalus adamanteus]|uniref:Retinol dehydrogenase 14 n=1 Tax=Crotalus adamanteus TaxID=8729 RepID=A0AAW1CBW2_CROAD